MSNRRLLLTLDQDTMPPAPDYILSTPLLAGAPRLVITSLNMADAEGSTVIREVDKPAAAESLYMLLGISSSDGAYTDLCYMGSAYSPATPIPILGMNTYSAGFAGTTMGLAGLRSGAKTIITAQLFQNQQAAVPGDNQLVGQLTVRVDGVTRLVDARLGQVRRDFINRLVIGDTSGIPWTGTIYRCNIYLSILRSTAFRLAERNLY